MLILNTFYKRDLETDLSNIIFIIRHIYFNKMNELYILSL